MQEKRFYNDSFCEKQINAVGASAAGLQQRQPGEIPQLLSVIDKELEILKDSISVLATRVAPVLSGIDGCANENQGSPANPSTSELGSRLSLIRNDIASISRIVTAITNKVEL